MFRDEKANAIEGEFDIEDLPLPFMKKWCTLRDKLRQEHLDAAAEGTIAFNPRLPGPGMKEFLGSLDDEEVDILYMNFMDGEYNGAEKRS